MGAEHDHGGGGHAGHNHGAGASTKRLAIALGLTTTFLVAELVGAGLNKLAVKRGVLVHRGAWFAMPRLGAVPQWRGDPQPFRCTVENFYINSNYIFIGDV